MSAPTPYTGPAYLGQGVIFHYADEKGPNGSSMAAATVTRVWGPDMVNLVVFGDCDPPRTVTSVSRAGSLHHQPGSNAWSPAGPTPA